MLYSIATSFALVAAVVATPMPQAAKTPTSSAPAGCSPSYSGKFQIQTVNVTTSSKRSVEKRQDGKLEISLADGVLTDSSGRIGNIVANHQFQFDPAPGQAGAIYTGGFSACGNGSLAIGGSAIFYQCLSGNFYNIYDESQGKQCSQVYINILSAGATTVAASQASDGQPTASPAAQQSDGQVTASSAATAAPVTQITDGQVQASTAAPVSQISDGQVQATTAGTAKPVTQISDGQIQATSAATAAPVTQISDGQIQATTAAAPVTQIGDGQIQAPTASPVTQISDGQIQAPANGTKPTGTISAPSGTGSPIAYTGAASKASVAGLLAIAGFAIAAL
ncbi:hypothetical protein B0A48_06333 [Cryoendolithus antarcticus]|uniref:Cell wall mannoprotein PIR1-like C-terminal domain-containing protein n=1 Tax=Cryoendolithus antarcticus TaxID=1507870 RepID=A0A1V8TAM7_9PEZI|nr:hypothetical protein B0A48_06333 [Cryoendolithus antarcticus]OQO27435.1 hypothetical protein B0A51_06311 [Rachicladosporium sp. CCFEE 5018]